MSVEVVRRGTFGDGVVDEVGEECSTKFTAVAGLEGLGGPRWSVAEPEITVRCLPQDCMLPWAKESLQQSLLCYC